MLETMSDMVSFAVLLLVTSLSLLSFVHIVTGKKTKKRKAVVHAFYQSFSDEAAADDEEVFYIENKEGNHDF